MLETRPIPTAFPQFKLGTLQLASQFELKWDRVPGTKKIEWALQDREKCIAKLYSSHRKTLLLAKASKNFLCSSDDLESSLLKIAQTALSLSDWCMIDLIQEDQTFERAVVTHRHPQMRTLTEELRLNFPLTGDAPSIVSRVLRKPFLIPEVNDSHFSASVCSSKLEKMLRTLGCRSYMSIPLIAHGNFLGTLTLISSHPNKRYNEDDVFLAEEVCSRAALAVYHAQRLSSAQKEIEARNHLIARVSHDLRTPITSIHLSADLLNKFLASSQKSLSSQFREKAEKVSQRILQSADWMNELVSDLLDFSQIKNSLIQLKKSNEILSSVVDSVVSRFGDIASQNSIQLISEIDSKQEIYADPKRISQALANLISNALKFTPTGGRVEITSSCEDSYVFIHVKDSGIGIDEANLRRIFDQYWQAKKMTHQSSPNHQKGGWGLGLWIVKSILDAHNGQVKVASQLGEGALFSIGIPEKKNEMSQS